MLIFAVEGFDTDMYQVALPSVSGAVSPSTATVWPTKFSAWVFCAVCCSDTSVESWVLDLSCCSTWANCTSCWVNWLVSSGSSGFWFFSCVVSSCRKVWKLPAMVPSSLPVELDDELLLVVCELRGWIAVMMCCPESSRLECRDRRSHRAGGRSLDAVPAAGRRPRPAPQASRRWTSLDRL